MKKLSTTYSRPNRNKYIYFSFIYDNEDYNIQLTEDRFTSDFEPFHIFKEIELASMRLGRTNRKDFITKNNIIIEGEKRK